MEESLIGFLIACAVALLLTLGFAMGEGNTLGKMEEANQTCWETHAVFVKHTNEYGGEFKCYVGSE